MTRFDRIRPAAAWGLTFLAFPPAGLAAMAVAGPIDGPGAALLGGAAAGAVIGTIQGLGARRRLGGVLGWAVTTTVGTAVGLLAGAGAVGYGTALNDLVVQGEITGAVVGLAQATRLRPLGARAYAWPLVVAGLWALGWATTTVIDVDVERQWAIFGASGAILATVGTGLVLLTARQRDREPVTR
jgi:uncharacterized RDD family membrane protein YckC